MKSKKYYIGLLAMLLALSSCGDFLEDYSQDKDYVRSWNDLNELILGDCYMPVNGSGYFKDNSNVGTFIHLLSDEADGFNEAGGSYMGFGVIHYEFGYLTWQLRVGAKEDFTSFYAENTTWTRMYKYINVANNVLESSKNIPQSTDEEKAGLNYVKGQAHFLRGWYYFWLTNMYGQPYRKETAETDLAVPLKTTKEVEDIKFTRNTVKECYDQIVSDLLAAEKEMTAAGSIINRKSTYRADSVSVQLLLSRVYLYMQNWEKAAEYAQKVIKNHGSLRNLNSDATYFAALNNTETIFTMGGDDLPTTLNNGYQSVSLTKSLYDTYSANDLRKKQWYWTNGNFVGVTKADPDKSVYDIKENEASWYNLTYTETRGTQREVSSIFWLRAGEAYLNLAEAEAYMGHEDEAKKAVNALRENRYITGAKDADITSTGSQLISDIRNERKRELACEGHRWFDLRRYRVCEVQPEKISITHHFGFYKSDTDNGAPLAIRTYVLPEDDPSWTMPIPNEVLTFNVGMQNNGNQKREYEGYDSEE